MIKAVENILTVLSAGRWGYTNTVGFWGLSNADKDSRHVHVYGEQSTITKMHCLKLDPYRHQTES